MGLGLNWYQIKNKTYYIPKVSTCHLLRVNVYFLDQNIIKRGIEV